MTDPVVVAQPVVVQTPEVEPEEVEETEFDAERAKAKIAKTNSEAKGLRIRVKELEGFEAKVKALEDSQKTESQKLADRAAKSEQELAAARLELITERIARKHGIADEDMDLLGAGTEEQIEGRAVRLAAKNAAAQTAETSSPPPTNRPAEKLRPGASPTGPPDTPKTYPAHWLPAGASQT